MTSENAYLVGLRLTGKKVVVVGGGTVAQRRLPLLIANGADVHVITRSATPAVEGMAGITLTLREFRAGDLDGAWYAIAATDDPEQQEVLFAELDRLWVEQQPVLPLFWRPNFSAYSTQVAGETPNAQGKPDPTTIYFIANQKK